MNGQPEFPPDIVDAAMNIAHDARQRGHGEHPCGSLFGVAVIARAIMAERERCAQIARGFWVDCGNGDFDDGVQIAAEVIASRIEGKPDHPEPSGQKDPGSTEANGVTLATLREVKP